MDIAIIGSGNVGGALARSLGHAGHRVTLAARELNKAQAAADAAGVRAGTVETAVAGAQVIILAVPYSAALEVAAEIAGVAAGKVVIDTTNPLSPDYSGLVTVGGPSAAERIAAALPGASVVKAFNTLFASVQADPTTLGVQLDGLYATDSDAAAATVAELLDSIGLRPVKVGPLTAARELEALAWLNISLQMHNGGDWRSAFTLVGAPAAALALPIAA